MTLGDTAQGYVIFRTWTLVTSQSAAGRTIERKCIAVNGIPSHSYEMSLVIWDHTGVTCHLTREHTALNPIMQTSTWFTYPGAVEGWVDLGDLLHIEMVYPLTDGHPSK